MDGLDVNSMETPRMFARSRMVTSQPVMVSTTRYTWRRGSTKRGRSELLLGPGWTSRSGVHGAERLCSVQPSHSALGAKVSSSDNNGMIPFASCGLPRLTGSHRHAAENQGADETRPDHWGWLRSCQMDPEGCRRGMSDQNARAGRPAGQSLAPAARLPSHSHVPRPPRQAAPSSAP